MGKALLEQDVSCVMMHVTPTKALSCVCVRTRMIKVVVAVALNLRPKTKCISLHGVLAQQVELISSKFSLQNT